MPSSRGIFPTQRSNLYLLSLLHWQAGLLPLEPPRARYKFTFSSVQFSSSLVTQLVKNPPAMQETWVRSWVGKIPWRRERLPTPVFWAGESHGLYSPLGHKESDTTEQLSLHSSVHRSVVSESLWPHGLCSPPGSSARGILQARILEWVAVPSSRGIFPTQRSNRVCCIRGGFFSTEPPRKS